MDTTEEIKKTVRNAYTEIVTTEPTSCCGPCGCSEDLSFASDYSEKDGYVKDADYALGCGIPTDAVRIQEGETVLDLGAGAGNDAFVARRLVGDTGKVIGLDFTPAMILKAQENAKKLGVTNVEFVLGDIESMPLADNTADVVVSNCVLNLLPDKEKGFAEMFRVMKPGGRFGISDIVVEGDLPEKVRRVAELYAGCVSGAIRKEAYLDGLRAAGFSNLVVQKEKEFHLTRDLLTEFLDPEDINAFLASGSRVLSITVSGERLA
jgi:SAM-dependent methyltransferase